MYMDFWKVCVVIYLVIVTIWSFLLAEIATIMEAVSGKSSFTSAEALQYLQKTTTVLQHDYNNTDAQLACSVVSMAFHIILS